MLDSLTMSDAVQRTEAGAHTLVRLFNSTPRLHTLILRDAVLTPGTLGAMLRAMTDSAASNLLALDLTNTPARSEDLE